MADLARYVVKLEAQTAKYQRELDRANRKLDTFHRRQTKKLDLVAHGFRRLAGAVVAVGLGRVIRDSINQADKFQKLTQRLGGTTEAYSELAFVAERSGLQFRVLELGLQRMSRRVAEAAVDMGEARGALRELGIDARKLSTLSIDRQFEIVADALNGVTKESDRTRLAMKLFDSEGVALLQTMTNGAEGIRDLRREARDLGATISGDVARQAQETNDKLTDFKTRTNAAAREITVSLLPALNASLEALTQFGVGLAVAFGNFGIDPISLQIEELTQQTRNWKSELQELTDRYLMGDTTGEERRLQLTENIALAEQKIARLKQQYLNKAAPDNRQPSGVEIPSIADVSGDIDTATDAMRTFLGKWETLEQRVDRQLAQLGQFKDAIIEAYGEDEFNRIEDRIWGQLLQPIELVPERVSKITDELEKTDEAAQQLGLTFESALENAIVAGENLSDVLKGLLQDLLRIAARKWIITPFVESLGFSADGRATGGPVAAGVPLLVGEQGPEIFMPQGNGSIVPNGQLGGVTNNYNFEAGADLATIRAEIIPMLERTSNLTLARVQQQRREGLL